MECRLIRNQVFYKAIKQLSQILWKLKDRYKTIRKY